MSGWPVSLRARLSVAAMLVTVAVTSAAAALAVAGIHAATSRELANAARTRLAIARLGVLPDGQLAGSNPALRAAYVQVLDHRGRVVASSAALSGVPPLLSLRVAQRSGNAVRMQSLTQPDVDLAVVADRQQVNGLPGAVIVGVDSQGFLSARHELWTMVELAVPLVVLLTGTLVWWIAGSAFRAVNRLAEQADALGGADTGQLLHVRTGDAELTRLVTSLNHLLVRLDTHYSKNLAAAAETTHRLRTPLATMRMEAELALLDDDPQSTRASLRQIVADTERLSHVIDALLAAASGHADLVDVEVLSADLGEDWRRQAEARGVDLRMNVRGQARVEVALLRAAVDPLVENAIRFAAEPPHIDVDCDTDAAAVHIRVSNHGAGIPAGHRDQLFEPWTGRRHGGLGLWLAREAARAAGGDVWCEEPGPPRTTFVARLPVVSWGAGQPAPSDPGASASGR